MKCVKCGKTLRRNSLNPVGLMDCECSAPTPSTLREKIASIICEHPPSIAEDSGQPEWCKRELDTVADSILSAVWEAVDKLYQPYKYSEPWLYPRKEKEECQCEYYKPVEAKEKE